MIASLRGRVVDRGDNSIVVDVGGVGFRVHVPDSLLERMGKTGQEVSLFTRLHVREGELSLYGCATAEDLALFELLLTVSGIGPKVALSLISRLSAAQLRDLIARGDRTGLTSVPGIGKKTADRIMLDLRDKLGVGLEFVSRPVLTFADEEVIAALTSLGYSVAEAQAAIQSLPADEAPLEERIRRALQYFSAR